MECSLLCYAVMLSLARFCVLLRKELKYLELFSVETVYESIFQEDQHI